MKQRRQKDNLNKKRALNNMGTTMLETMVAFVVLMVIMGILYGIIAFCSELRMSAADTNKAMEVFAGEIYKSAPNESLVEVKDCKDTYKKNSGSNTYTTLFYMQLSTTRTNPANLPPTPPETKPIALKDFRAKTYKYVGTGYQGVTPKAIEFIHKKDWSSDNTGD